MAQEYARLSLLVNGKYQLPALVLEDEPSDPYGLTALGAGNHDFSILVGLRHLHQTQHAAEGVRTRDSAETNGPGESVWCKLIRELNGGRQNRDIDYRSSISENKHVKSLNNRKTITCHVC